MIVIKIFKESAGKINKSSAVSFESCRKRLKLYFSGLEKIKKRLLAGEIISVPYVTFQKDRRIKEKRVENERRVPK
ncbi:hypothetical protein ES695_02815 [Candidatus Atribacteria bacterium 1244-E10-H5-B2]|nr:MAG: hypothetical protein ES695_02815 [Candidatus Atribacteria bacterium 1244-E10-H5-B2]